MAACGQTSEQKPHSVQKAGFQTGIIWARLRFSVGRGPLGKVPSTGKALVDWHTPSPGDRVPVSANDIAEPSLGVAGDESCTCGVENGG